ncbi:MAG TPA: AI-2E family transporter [Verrucomicrobiae bacterium]|jgi:predicted PurR-regulated permease PerM
MNPKSPTPNQQRILWFALTGLAVGVVVGLLVAGVWGLSQLLNVLKPVLWPLAIAGVVACLLSPAVDFFERRKIPRVRAIILVFVITFAIVAGVLASVIPQVVIETRELAHKVPEYSQRLQNRTKQFIAQPPELLRRFLPKPDDSDTNSVSGQDPLDTPMLADATSWLTGSLPKISSWLLSQIGKVASGFGFLAGLVLVPVYVFYLLLEKRGIEERWRDYLPVRDSAAKDEVIFVLDSIKQNLVAFFRGQVLVAICDAVLYTIGFLVVGVNYAFLLGFAAVFLTMIPFLGAIFICITALTLAFVQYGDWTHPLLVLAVFGVVQTLEGLFISPKIMGKRVGLHPLVIIIAVMTGTTLLGGILGGVLAIPLAAALRVIMFRYVWKKRETETTNA